MKPNDSKVDPFNLPVLSQKLFVRFKKAMFKIH